MVFESLVVQLLEKKLGDYVEGVDLKSLRIAVWSGDITLENLRLKPTALRALDLPVSVRRGYLGRLVIKVPWRALGRVPVIVEVDRLLLLVRPKQDSEHDESFEAAAAEKAKQSKLDELEAIRNQVKDNTASSGARLSSPLLSNIIRNLQMQINNVHVRYEDDESDAEHPFAMGVTLSSLVANTVDEQGQPKFSIDPLQNLYKLLSVQNLSVYFDANSPPNLLNLTEKDCFDLMTSMIPPSQELRGTHYLLEPLSIAASIVLTGSNVPHLSQPKGVADVTIERLALNLQDRTYQSICMLADFFVMQNRRFANMKYRPKVPLKGNAHKWFEYIVDVHLAKRRAKRAAFQWSAIKQACENRRRYVQLYVEKIFGAKTSLDKLIELESQLTFEQIRIFRAMAHGRADAEKVSRTAQQQSSWTSSFVNWAVGTDHNKTAVEEAAKVLDVELTAEEKNAILEILQAEDETVKLFDSSSYPPEYVQWVAKFEMNQGSFALFQSSTAVAQLACAPLKCELQVRPCYGAIRFEAKLGSLTIIDPRVEGQLPLVRPHKGIQLREILGPTVDIEQQGLDLAEVVVDTKPLNNAADMQVNVILRAVQYQHSAVTLIDILSIFTMPEQLLIRRQLLNKVSQTLDSLTTEAMEALQSSLDSPMRLDLGVDIASPRVLFHQRNALGMKPACSSALLLNFGRLFIRAGQWPAASTSLDTAALTMNAADMHTYDPFYFFLDQVGASMLERKAGPETALVPSPPLLEPFAIAIRIDRVKSRLIPAPAMVRILCHCAKLSLTLSRQLLPLVILCLPIPERDSESLAPDRSSASHRRAHDSTSSIAPTLAESASFELDASQLNFAQSTTKTMDSSNESFYDAPLPTDSLLNAALAKSTSTKMKSKVYVYVHMHEAQVLLTDDTQPVLSAAVKNVAADVDVSSNGIKMGLRCRSLMAENQMQVLGEGDERHPLISAVTEENSEDDFLILSGHLLDEQHPAFTGFHQDFKIKLGSAFFVTDSAYLLAYLKFFQDMQSDLLTVFKDTPILSDNLPTVDLTISASVPTPPPPPEFIPAKKSSQLQLQVDISQLELHVLYERLPLATLHAQDAGIMFKSLYQCNDIRGELGQFGLMCDFKDPSLHSEIVKCGESETTALQFHVTMYDPPLPDCDLRLDLKLASISYVHVQSFCNMLIEYVMHLLDIKRILGNAAQVAMEKLDTKMQLSLELGNSTVMIPASASSSEMLILHPGILTISNSFSGTGDETILVQLSNCSGSCCDLPVMADTEMQMSVVRRHNMHGAQQLSNTSGIVEDTKDIPFELDIVGNITRIHLSLNSQQYTVLLDIFEENLLVKHPVDWQGISPKTGLAPSIIHTSSVNDAAILTVPRLVSDSEGEEEDEDNELEKAAPDNNNNNMTAASRSDSSGIDMHVPPRQQLMNSLPVKSTIASTFVTPSTGDDVFITEAPKQPLTTFRVKFSCNEALAQVFVDSSMIQSLGCLGLQRISLQAQSTVPPDGEPVNGYSIAASVGQVRLTDAKEGGAGPEGFGDLLVPHPSPQSLGTASSSSEPQEQIMLHFDSSPQQNLMVVRVRETFIFVNYKWLHDLLVFVMTPVAKAEKRGVRYEGRPVLQDVSSVSETPSKAPADPVVTPAFPVVDETLYTKLEQRFVFNLIGCTVIASGDPQNVDASLIGVDLNGVFHYTKAPMDNASDRTARSVMAVSLQRIQLFTYPNFNSMDVRQRHSLVDPFGIDVKYIEEIVEDIKRVTIRSTIEDVLMQVSFRDLLLVGKVVNGVSALLHVEEDLKNQVPLLIAIETGVPLTTDRSERSSLAGDHDQDSLNAEDSTLFRSRYFEPQSLLRPPGSLSTTVTTRDPSYSDSTAIPTAAVRLQVTEELSVHMGIAKILIVDDFGTVDVPLLEVIVNNCELEGRDWSQAKGTLFVDVVLLANYYNGLLSAWEPLIETYGLKIQYSKGWNSGAEEAETSEHPQQFFAIYSEDRLNVNCTYAFITQVLPSFTSWFASVSGQLDERRLSSNDPSPLAIAANCPKMRKNFHPYSVRNSLGIELSFATSTKKLGNEDFSNTSFSTVAPDESVPFSFQSPMKYKHSAVELESLLSLKVSGMGMIPNINVKSIGSQVFTLRHQISSILSHGVATPAPPLSVLDANNALRVIVDVALEGSRKVVTVRSPIMVINATPHPIELTVFPVDGADAEKLNDLNPSQQVCLPLQLQRWRILVRPVEPRDFELSDEPLDWRNHSNMLESGVSTKMTSLRCHRSAEASFEGKADVFTMAVKVETGLLSIANSPAHTYTILAPLVVTNRLACSCEFGVVGSDVHVKLESNASEELFSLDFGSTISISLTLTDFNQSDPVCIFVPFGAPGQVGMRLFVKDCNGHTLPLCLDYAQQGREVVIYSRYILFNGTTLPLLVKDTHNNLAAGCAESGWAGESPLHFDFLHGSNKQIVLYTNDGSQPSAPFYLDTAGQAFVVSIKEGSRLLQFGVRIETGQGEHYRSKMVRIFPWIMVVNSTGFALQLCDQTDNPECNDTRQTPGAITLLAKSSAPFYWSKSSSHQLLAVRLLGNPMNSRQRDRQDKGLPFWKWSRTFPVGEVGLGRYVLKMREYQGANELTSARMAIYLIDVELKMSEVSLEIILRETLGTAPFRIENNSLVPLAIRQHGLTDVPFQRIGINKHTMYAPDDPMLKPLKAEFFVDTSLFVELDRRLGAVKRVTSRMSLSPTQDDVDNDEYHAAVASILQQTDEIEEDFFLIQLDDGKVLAVAEHEGIQRKFNERHREGLYLPSRLTRFSRLSAVDRAPNGTPQFSRQLWRISPDGRLMNRFNGNVFDLEGSEIPSPNQYVIVRPQIHSTNYHQQWIVEDGYIRSFLNPQLCVTVVADSEGVVMLPNSMKENSHVNRFSFVRVGNEKVRTGNMLNDPVPDVNTAIAKIDLEVLGKAVDIIYYVWFTIQPLCTTDQFVLTDTHGVSADACKKYFNADKPLGPEEESLIVAQKASSPSMEDHQLWRLTYSKRLRNKATGRELFIPIVADSDVEQRLLMKASSGTEHRGATWNMKHLNVREVHDRWELIHGSIVDMNVDRSAHRHRLAITAEGDANTGTRLCVRRYDRRLASQRFGMLKRAPGSGHLRCEVVADGFTRVLRIEDVKFSALLQQRNASRSSSTAQQPNLSPSARGSPRLSHRRKKSAAAKAATQDENDVTVLKVMITLSKGIGLSVIDKKPRELLYLLIDDISVTIESSLRDETFTCDINAIQLDNMAQHDCMFPVVLFPSDRSYSSSEVPKNERIPFLHMFAARSLKHMGNVSVYRVVDFLLQEASVQIEEIILLEILEYVDECLRGPNAKGSHRALPSQLADFANPTRSLSYHDLAKSTDDYIFLFLLDLQPIVFNLSVSKAHSIPDHLVRIRNVYNINWLPSSVSYARLQLHGHERQNIFVSQKDLIAAVGEHYKQAVIRQLYKVVGSLDMLAPVALLSGLGTGVKDFFYEPVHGLRRDGAGFRAGLIKGSESLFANIKLGAVDATSRLAGAASTTLARVTMDRHYQEQRAALKVKAANSHGSKRVGYGFTALGRGLVSGVTGVLTNPVNGAREDGARGFFRGVATGTIGLIAKPLAGVLDAASETTAALQNIDVVHSRISRHVRLARHIVTFEPLEEYSEAKASGTELLFLLGRICKDEYYVFHTETIQDGPLFFVTSLRVMLLERQVKSSASAESNWKIAFSTLLSLISRPRFHPTSPLCIDVTVSRNVQVEQDPMDLTSQLFAFEKSETDQNRNMHLAGVQPIKGTVKTIEFERERVAQYSLSMLLTAYEEVVKTQFADLAGAAMTISAGGGKQYVCANSDENLFEWDGSEWKLLSQQGRMVSKGIDGELWCVDSMDHLFRFNGTSWDLMPGMAMYLSVASAEHIAIVARNGQVFKWNRADQAWLCLQGNFVSCAIGIDGEIFGVTSIGTFSQFRRNNWVDFLGRGVGLACTTESNMISWNAAGFVSRLDSEMHTWSQLPWLENVIHADMTRAGNVLACCRDGLIRTISPEDMITYAATSRSVNTRMAVQPPGHCTSMVSSGGYGDKFACASKDYKLYLWNGRQWQTISGSGQWISRGSDGELWMVDRNQCYRWTGTSWGKLSSELIVKICVARRGLVLGISRNGTVMRYNESSNNWQALKTMFTDRVIVHAAVGMDGSMYIVSSHMTLYFWNRNDWQYSLTDANIVGVACANSKRLICWNKDGIVMRWLASVRKWEDVHFSEPIIEADIADDGTIIACSASGTIHLIRPQTLR